MNEETVDAQLEEEVLETETEEVEEVEETEVEEESEEAVAESSDDAGSDEEEVEEQAETGMDMNPAEFKVPTDMKAFANEIALGMKEVFAEFEAKQTARFDQIQEQSFLADEVEIEGAARDPGDLYHVGDRGGVVAAVAEQALRRVQDLGPAGATLGLGAPGSPVRLGALVRFIPDRPGLPFRFGMAHTL